MFTLVNLKQGGRGWLAYRANKLNASDAPAAMSVHPTRSRRSLVRQLATGIAPEFSSFVQDRILDKGHQFEALAGPLMAEHAGVDLFPVVGYDSDAPQYSASYDGLDMEWRIAAEHKSLNEVLRECMFDGCTGTDLPIYHQVQMEHQCMVCPTVERVLFMASKWDRNGNLIEERHCWYTPNPKLRAQMLAAWEDVVEDARNYDPADDDKPELMKKEHEQLPVLNIDVSGQVLASNLNDFERVVKQRIAIVKTDLETDQDFADADVDAKFLRDVADRMRLAVKAVRGKMESVDDVLKMLESLDKLSTDKAIIIENKIKSEKAARKAKIITDAQTRLNEYIDALNTGLGAKYLQRTIGPFDAAAKNLRSLDSISDKVNAALSLCKADADELATRYRVNRDHLEHADGSWMTLFPDFATVGGKEHEDFKGIALVRITKHKEALEQAENARKEREAAAQKKLNEEAAAPATSPAPEPERVVVHTTGTGMLPRSTGGYVSTSAPAPTVSMGHAPVEDDGVRVTLGDIKAIISPLQIDAAGLVDLGYPHIGTDKSAKLYREVDVPAMLLAMIAHLQKAHDKASTPF